MPDARVVDVDTLGAVQAPARRTGAFAVFAARFGHARHQAAWPRPAAVRSCSRSGVKSTSSFGA
ncbi:hypothetical protein [Streptomyces sp. NPDC046862]|uniref:hypothetical protein n=1 Tax=Streptomyces sp. NPDC046862 TaxID=3154603 RepID=UPI003453454F